MLTLLILACNGGDEVDVTVELSEAIPTVVTLSWEGGPGLVTVDGREIQGDGQALIVGLKPDTPYDFELALDSGESGSGGLRTGLAPISLPLTSVEGQGIDGFFATTVLSTVSAGVLLDRDGEIVWWNLDERADIQVVRCEPLLDGTGMVMGVSTNDPNATERAEEIIEISWDGSQKNVLAAPDYHHDLVQLGDGDYLYLGLTSVEVEGKTVLGDTVVRLAADGTTTELWNAFDDFPYDVERVTSERAKYWSHANAMDVDRDARTLTVSLRNLNTIAHLDLDSGELLWAIGEFGTLELVGEYEYPWTRLQHQFDFIDDDTLIVFDNSTPDELDTRVVIYDLDLSGGTYEEAWTWRSEDDLFAYAMGSVEVLPDGNYLVTITSAAQLEQVTPAGESVWKVNGDIGAGLGYTARVESLP